MMHSDPSPRAPRPRRGTGGGGRAGGPRSGPGGARRHRRCTEGRRMTEGQRSGSDGAALAWQTLRGYENPDRYLEVRAQLARPPAALAQPADEHHAEHAGAYLTHSCDLTLSGGLATAVAAPLAACALAEQYVLRRVGGAGLA